MTMKTQLLGAAAALAVVAAAPSANALVWVTPLEYDDSGLVASMGTVTVTDGLEGGNAVQVRVDLNQGSLVDTGGHYAFAFNLMDDVNNVVTVDDPTGGINEYIYANTLMGLVETCTGTGKNKVCNMAPGLTDPPPYKMAPFGDDWNNAFALKLTGGNNTVPPPFIFTVRNVNGITFAGEGNVPGPGGQLQLPLGGGTHFYSNSTGNKAGYTGGWWFAVDTSGTSDTYDPTGVIAGRDAFAAIPEPGAWALMILGFGAAGSMLRRRRTVAV